MRIFFSAGEPSGDLHGANFIRTLGRLCPGVECAGFGGDQMAAAGCRLLYPLAQLALLGFIRVLGAVPFCMKLLAQADRFLATYRPDAVVLIDNPGFNWWVARRARARGVPVYYFVPPQMWAWGGWRVGKMRRLVDHALCTLPFENEWYRSRGVEAHYVGHPYFDELLAQRLDPVFLAEQQNRGGTIVGLLPGSRKHEVEDNLPMLVRTAAHVHAARPDTRFLVACFREAHREKVNAYLKGGHLPVEVHVGRTPEIIELSRACAAVSGSVGLELLFRGTPAVVVYGTSRLHMFLFRHFKTVPHISLVNLLANQELFPEYVTDRCEAEAMGDHILRWLNDESAYAGIRAALADLRRRVAAPGACARAARYVVETLEQDFAVRRAAA